MIASVDAFWWEYADLEPQWPSCRHENCVMPAIWWAYLDTNTASCEPRCALHINDLPGVAIEEGSLQ